ncbi:MAG: GTP 3',8-cyclase MoaA [Gemmatimonadales bacterium]
MTLVRDRLQRPLGSVRVSVTDRCNMRCRYCMPEEEYLWLPRDSLLSFEEISRVVGVVARLGAGKIRLTGGEPLLRRNLDQLVAMIRPVAGVREVALTTNALLLAAMAKPLRDSGLDRITVSLDTLQPQRMAAFARSTHHAGVVAGIDAALAAGFGGVKLNTVVVRGFNDDEIADIAEFARLRGIEPRYIEYMDVGGATRWTPDAVVPRSEIVAALERRYGPAEPMSRGDNPHAPAERFRFADGMIVGIVASTTAPFCRDCDRARITADGTLFLCLYADRGIDLRDPMRHGVTDIELAALVEGAWQQRSDRGAETRIALGDRGILVSLVGLRADPRREMHVRGG